MASWLGDAVDFTVGELGPTLERAFDSAHRFYKAYGSNELEAMAQAVTILVIVFVLYLSFKYLYKAARKIDSIVAGFSGLASWILKLIKGSSQYVERLVKVIAQKAIRALLRRKSYSDFFSWCAMMPKDVEQSMLLASPRGSVHVASQRSLGVVCFAIALWSSGGFYYALHSAILSGGQSSIFVQPVLVACVMLYGVIIFFFDRSIIAPHADSVPTGLSSIGHGGWAGLAGWLRQVDPRTILKFSARVSITVMIAKFTALPLTLFILSGSVRTAIEEHNKINTDGHALVQAKVAESKQSTAMAKASSALCEQTRAALDAQDQLIHDEARNCRGVRSGTPCIGPKTLQLRAERPAYVQSVAAACTLTAQEENDFAAQLTNASSQAVVQWKSPPDLLLGGHVLDGLRATWPSSFDPVGITFWLLFAVEMMPVMMKLWQHSPGTNRRVNRDRRVAPVVPWSQPERRVGDRRLSIVR